MDVLAATDGPLRLARRPDHPTLRAYDAADVLALEHLGRVQGSVVVLNDGWGALTTGLAPASPVSVSDSWTTRRAIEENLSRNAAHATVVASLDTLPEHIDVLVFRIPRTVALLEDQLHRVAPALHAGSTVLGAGMVKQIHTSTLTLVERIIGPTRTSLATRKARLIHADVDTRLRRPADPWPRTLTLDADAPAGLAGVVLVQHAGVFSADHLDIGTRFLLEHLPRSGGRVVDLGCGNGVLGVAAGLADPSAQLVFVDDSYLAVESARATWAGVHGDRPAQFAVGDGMDPVTGPVDVVLCNPPFHVGRSTGDEVAWRMFLGARRALRTGGELWVVGNRHLGHHVRLKRLFGRCDVVASNAKFVVLRAVSR